MFYSVADPACVQERQQELREEELARVARREERAKAVHDYLVSTTAGQERQSLAASVSAAYLRAHAFADDTGLVDVVEQAQAVAALVRDAASSAASQTASGLRSLSLRLRGDKPGGECLETEEEVDVTPGATREQVMAAECKEAGNTAFRAGRYEAALRAYTRACELHPEVAVYHANQAAALVALQRCDEAIAAYITALGRDPKHGRSRQRLVALVVSAETLNRALEAARSNSESALLSSLQAVESARGGAKTCFADKRFGQAEAIYSRALAPTTDDGTVSADAHAAGLIGSVLLLCNRAACRSAQGNHEGALADAELALRLAPDHPKAAAHRDGAVKALRSRVQDEATAQRDATVDALRAQGVDVPHPFGFPMYCPGMAAASPRSPSSTAALPWGRMACTACRADGRDPLACRAGLKHTLPDADIDAFRLGGRVRLRRAVAHRAQGVSLGPAAGEAAGDEYEAGTIASFDWRTGLHTVERDNNGGTLHVRLINVKDLHYEPPQAQRLKD
jgi:tetratricopeptide (TPR) repeat protein